MVFDLVVIGGGIGGLVTAALSQRAGLRTALLEAHTKLGGCAGYFDRGPYTFDAGATALMGLQAEQVLGDLIDLLELDFQGTPTTSYRLHLPDDTLDIVMDVESFEQDAVRVLARNPREATAQRRFWRLQAAVGNRLFDAAARIPRLPLRSVGDALHDFRILGLSGVLAASTSTLTVQDVLRGLGLNEARRFHSVIAMLLQDTAQAGPETVPFANAAACLQAYRMGMCRPQGGMQRLVNELGQRLTSLGGTLRTAGLVDRVEPIAKPAGRTGERPRFEVITRRGERFRSRDVAFNVPLDRAAAILGRVLKGRLERAERRSRAAWSAVTGYLAIRREAVPDETPLFHQVLRSFNEPIPEGNNVLISLSPCDDEGYGPRNVRVATLSTHTRPEDWQGLDRTAHAARKRIYQDRLLDALGRALPDARGALAHHEFATPRSFQRYTRRTSGAVGGAPVSRWNSNFLALGADVLGPGLWLVGDSVFPGQGTMAAAISAIRVVERMTGRSWPELRSLRPIASTGSAEAATLGR